MYEIAALIPSSAKLRNPSKFVAVVFNPKTYAPKQSMRILREKNPRTKTRTLKNKETRAFLMLCTVRFISAIGLKLILMLRTVIFRHDNLTIKRLQVFDCQI